ncbi:MAG: hypothetical protein ACI9C4_003046, partial [Paraglaciecola sp.]
SCLPDRADLDFGIIVLNTDIIALRTDATFWPKVTVVVVKTGV